MADTIIPVVTAVALLRAGSRCARRPAPVSPLTVSNLAQDSAIQALFREMMISLILGGLLLGHGVVQVTYDCGGGDGGPPPATHRHRLPSPLVPYLPPWRTPAGGCDRCHGHAST